MVGWGDKGKFGQNRVLFRLRDPGPPWMFLAASLSQVRKRRFICKKRYVKCTRLKPPY